MPNDPWFTEAHVEKAAQEIFRTFWSSSYWLSAPEGDRARYLQGARAALSAIPDPRAAARAEGFEAAAKIADDKSNEWYSMRKDPKLGVSMRASTSMRAARAIAEAIRIAALKPEPKP